MEVHTSYRVWSALVVTSWSNRVLIGCRGCGDRAKIIDLLFSLALGWWGLPWGPLMTVVQVGRNIVASLKRTDYTVPSKQLEKLVRLRLAANLVATTPS